MTPRFIIGYDELAEREFVVHLWEPLMVFEVHEEPVGWRLDGIHHQVKPEDMDASAIARLAREAGDAYRVYLEASDDE